MRLRKLQVARRAVQILVVVFMLLVPALSRYVNYLSARELDKTIERWDGSLQGTTLSAIDATLRRLPGGEVERSGRPARQRTQVLEHARQLRGGPWSAQIGSLSMTDPLAAAESLAASKRSVRVLWVSVVVPVALALVLGRVFCSWICPAGFLFELTDKLRRVLRWLELRPRDVRPLRSTKFVVLGAGLLMALALSLPIIGYVYPPAILGREVHDLVFGLFDRAELGRTGFSLAGLTWMSLILLAIVLVEVTVSRRWWCRYVCPGGGLYALLGWRRPLRVARREASCTQCGACDRACHLGLRPMQERVMGLECDNCGQCISHCNDDALGLAVRLQARGGVMRRALPAAVLGALLLGLTPAAAHHILGIPHYAYDERYPQVPVLTYKVDAGPYDVEMTGYPGTPAAGEQCFLNVYLIDRATGAPFAGPVALEVLRDRLLSADQIVYGPITAELEESVFKFYPRFDEEANYTIRVRFEAEGAPWTIDLPMVVGTPGSPWRVVAGTVVGATLFLLTIRALKIKRERRRSAPRTVSVPS